MRSFMSFTLAVILTAIFTLFSVPENVFAKTGFMVYGGKSVSPNGVMENQTFDGAAFGGGIRFNMHKRVSIGLDYMGQEATGLADHHGGIGGKNIIVTAEFFGYDISAYNINPSTEYAYADIAESTSSKLMTGTIYISLYPENGASKRTVEPVIGFSLGINALKGETVSNAFYHPDLRAVEDMLGEMGFDYGYGHHWRFSTPWDDGNDSNGVGAITELNKYEFVYGPTFGLNFYLPGNLVICPEVKYLINFGLIARTGIGFAF
jgi:hypothetical protein